MKTSNPLGKLKKILIAVIIMLCISYLIISSRHIYGIELRKEGKINSSLEADFNSSNRRPSDNPVLVYELIPNTRVQNEGSWVKFNRTLIETVNSDGFRGRDYPVEKPKEVYRIIVLGDSFAFGYGVNDNETFSYYLEQKLNSLNISGKRFEVLNLGVGGYNTFQEVESLNIKGLKYNPDLVIIAHHGSDMENISEIEREIDEMYSNYTSGKQNVTNNTYATLRAYFQNKAFQNVYEDMAKKTFDQVFENVRQPMEDIYNISKNKNFSLMITTFPNGYMYKEQAEKLAVFSTERGICYLDFSVAYADKDLYAQTVHPTMDAHPNPYAYAVFADYIINKMKECGFIATG